MVRLARRAVWCIVGNWLARAADAERRWDTRVGTIEVKVPRPRDGSFFPSLLEPRRRAERALVAVVQEVYLQGVSTPPCRRPGAGGRDAEHQQEPAEFAASSQQNSPDRASMRLRCRPPKAWRSEGMCLMVSSTWQRATFHSCRAGCTTVELLATSRPFDYFSVHNHFEQMRRVPDRRRTTVSSTGVAIPS